MERREPVRTEEVARLRSLFVRGMPEDAGRDAAWAELRKRPIKSPRALADYHDLLLFLLAYPWNRRDHRIAGEELKRVADLVASMVERNAADRHALMNSGIAGSPSRGSFGIDLVRWLSARADAHASLDEFEGDASVCRAIWASACAPVEREAAEDERRPVIEAIRMACAGDDGAALRELVAAVDRSSTNHGTRAALWEAMRPTIAFQPSRSPLTRTWARGADRGLFLRRIDQQGAPDVRALPREKLLPLERLTKRERQGLPDAVRGVLIGHLRETDTAVLCEARDIDLQPMGEGVHVALLALPHGRRMPFDAYVGYVAFVNAMPVAYGGAWIFPGRSKIGVNVFPAYRGGPSGWLFARIIQCYAMRFGIGRFEAESYQLGHENPEGIRSGAYWFYDRLGFRTADPALARVAHRERSAAERDRSHRTEEKVLRKLASEPMRLELFAENAPVFDLVDLGEAVLRQGAPHGGVDRAMANALAVERVARALGADRRSSWPEAERAAFDHLAPAIGSINDLAGWSRNGKRSLIRLMRAKGSRTEDRYIRLLRKNSRLLHAWEAIARAMAQ